MKRAQSLIIGLFLCSAIFAQQERMLDPLLDAYLQRNEHTGSMLELFVHGNVQQVRAFTEAKGGIFKRTVKGVSAVRIPVNAVREMAALDAVDGFEFSLDQGHVLNDSMKVHNRIVQIHTGQAPLQLPFDGSGTLVGVIDSGIELLHPDFQNSDGSTRVMKLWDQNLPISSNTPAAYGYGQVWDSTGINAGQCPHVDQVGYFGHGSTVTGTAAGNGLATGTHGGAAPGADLLIVSNDLTSPNWHATVVDAVEWIFTEADALGKPCVINISLGSYYGSHDGLDAAALMIDDLINEQPGRAVVCAAGNSGGLPAYHLRTEVDADTSFTWFKYRSGTQFGYGAATFELWADTVDFNNVRFAFAADQETPSYEFLGRTDYYDVEDALITGFVDTLKNNNGDVICPILCLATLRGAQYRVQVIYKQPTPNDLNFRFETTGSGAFDVWSTSVLGTSDMVSSIPSVGDFPPIEHYVLPDVAQSMVSSWACSPRVLTVGNYYNETDYLDMNGNPQTVGGTEGDLVFSSSSGPTRDGRIKPDLAATGDVTFSSGPLDFLQTLIDTEPHKVAPGGFHFRGGGTSIAAPGVTGAVALFFEKCNNALWSEVKDAIIDHTVTDAFTGSTPNPDWGYGKLNAFDALVSSNYDTQLSVMGDLTICEGDSVQVSGVAGMSSYQWDHGDTVKVIYLEEQGDYFLVTRDQSGCIGISDTIEVQVNPSPDIPTISQNGNILISSTAPHYQWIYEGLPLDGDTLQELEVMLTGNYQVQVSNEFDCTATSEVINIITVDVPEAASHAFQIYPNPASRSLNLTFPENHKRMQVELLDLRGSTVKQWQLQSVAPGEVVNLQIEEMASGIYSLRCTSDRGSEVVPIMLR